MTKQEFLKKWEGVELCQYYISDVGVCSCMDFCVSIYEKDGVWKVRENDERGVYHVQEGTEEEMFQVFNRIVAFRKRTEDARMERKR